MTDLTLCHDCNVTPGTPHIDGCDTARCTVCGWQRISCEHADTDDGWGEVWTGIWPGDVEVREGLATDLNDLASKHAAGMVVWNGTRLVRPDPAQCRHWPDAFGVCVACFAEVR